MDKISVIVPIYNVEPYIERAVWSLLLQSWQEMEILLIDDGSTDRSGEICEEIRRNWESRHRNKHREIVIRHIPNGGQSHARNLGRVPGGFVPCGARFRACVENFIVDASIFVVSIDMCVRQATECDRWMPRHQEPMKDVVTCDKPRGAGGRALIRGFPNGETSKVTGREAGDCPLNV